MNIPDSIKVKVEVTGEAELVELVERVSKAAAELQAALENLTHAKIKVSVGN